jgi:hypothetical protein
MKLNEGEVTELSPRISEAIWLFHDHAYCDFPSGLSAEQVFSGSLVGHCRFPERTPQKISTTRYRTKKKNLSERNKIRSRRHAKDWINPLTEASPNEPIYPTAHCINKIFV